MTTSTPNDAVTTLVVKKVIGGGTSTATFQITRHGDGSFQFLDLNGNKVVMNDDHNDILRKLFDKVNSLT